MKREYARLVLTKLSGSSDMTTKRIGDTVSLLNGKKLDVDETNLFSK